MGAYNAMSWQLLQNQSIDVFCLSFQHSVDDPFSCNALCWVSKNKLGEGEKREKCYGCMAEE